MYVNEYGDSSLPKWLMFHPLGVTGENLYELVHPHLKREYCILSPDQGGHGKSGPYISLDDEMETLTTYLLERGYTDFVCVSGSSMGTIGVYEMVKDERFHVNCAWFESGLFKKNAPLVHFFMRRMFYRMIEEVQKDPLTPIERHVKLYGEAFAEMMRDNFKRITKTDIKRISDAFCYRRMVTLPEEMQERIHLDWGDEDILERLSRGDVPKYFPASGVTVRKGYGHCSYMAKNTEEYMVEMERFIRECEHR